jgi:alkanesulfonate monooxygenase SsuD/methylene tetrahydromethanopterin reductase-like flavin-dependent oxidoreductase (luciferase family)
MAFLLAILLPLHAIAEGRPTVQFGVQIAPENATYDEIVTTWKLLEDLGYDSAWLNDHFIPTMGDRDQAHFEAWTMLAALATQSPARQP